MYKRPHIKPSVGGLDIVSIDNLIALWGIGMKLYGTQNKIGLRMYLVGHFGTQYQNLYTSI